MPALTRAEWLEQRRSYMCASDAAAALGMSKWASPADIARDKWGERIEEKTGEQLERGNILEDFIRHMYARRTGHEIIPGAFLVSQEHPWMAATPDGADVTTNELVQIKTTIMWAAHRWEVAGDAGEIIPTIPPEYRVQGQHEMAVTGAQRNMFVVLFADASTFRSLCWSVARAPSADENEAGRSAEFDALDDHVRDLEQMEDPPCRFATYPLDRDDTTIDSLIEQEHRFWEMYVQEHVLPPDKYAPEEEMTILEATEEQREFMEVAREHWIGKKHHEEGYDEVKGILAEVIGPATGIRAEGIGTITYKAPQNVKPQTNWAKVLDDVRSFIPPDRLEEAIADNTAKPPKARVFLPKWDGIKRARKAKA